MPDATPQIAAWRADLAAIVRELDAALPSSCPRVTARRRKRRPLWEE